MFKKSMSLFAIATLAFSLNAETKKIAIKHPETIQALKTRLETNQKLSDRGSQVKGLGAFTTATGALVTIGAAMLSIGTGQKSEITGQIVWGGILVTGAAGLGTMAVYCSENGSEDQRQKENKEITQQIKQLEDAQ